MHEHKETGKKYFGTTKQRLTKRWQCGHGYRKNSWFWGDIEKYGWDSFSHTVVASSLTKTEALDMEEFLISRYNTTDQTKGYNMRSGGLSNYPVDEVSRNISKAKMGHEVRKEVREKLSAYGRIAVAQLSLDGQLIDVHPSITIAADAVGAHKTNIWAVCKGRKKTCCGYKWKYLEG